MKEASYEICADGVGDSFSVSRPHAGRCWRATGSEYRSRREGTRSRRVNPPAGRPALPSVFLDASLESAPRNVISVKSKRAAAALSLEEALEQARPGDVIELEAGETYVGNFVLPAKEQEARDPRGSSFGLRHPRICRRGAHA